MRKKSPKLPQSQNRGARRLGRGLRWDLHSKRPTMSRRTVQSLHFAPDIRQALSFNGRYSHSTAPWKMGYIQSYTHPTTHHTQKKGAKKWIKKWHEVAHKKVWCKNGISDEAKARPHEERASFRALNSTALWYPWTVKIPQQIPCRSRNAFLGGLVAYKIQQLRFWSWHHESWMLCDCLTNTGRQNAKQNTENPAKHLGISRCRYLCSTSWLARNSLKFHTSAWTFFWAIRSPMCRSLWIHQMSSTGKPPQNALLFSGYLYCPTRLANHAYKALSYDIADLPASVSKKPQLQQVKRSMSKYGNCDK